MRLSTTGDRAARDCAVRSAHGNLRCRLWGGGNRAEGLHFFFGLVVVLVPDEHFEAVLFVRLRDAARVLDWHYARVRHLIVKVDMLGLVVFGCRDLETHRLPKRYLFGRADEDHHHLAAGRDRRVQALNDSELDVAALPGGLDRELLDVAEVDPSAAAERKASFAPGGAPVVEAHHHNDATTKRGGRA
jgi:hypothetical protein